MLCIYKSRPVLRGKSITRSVCENKPIFHANYVNHITYSDIEDALDASRNMKSSQKKQYFYSLGINLEHVSKYYHTIQVLEKQFIPPKISPFTKFQEKIFYTIYYILNMIMFVIAFIFAEL